MAISQAMCTSFKRQILVGVHNLRPSGSGGNTFKIALYPSSATYDANTTAYSATGEVTGTNYVAGGNTLSNTANNVTSANAVGYATFGNTTWATSTITARGAVIYNSNTAINDWSGSANASSTNAAVCVLDFGSDKTSTAGDFTINFPTYDNVSAIIRIA